MHIEFHQFVVEFVDIDVRIIRVRRLTLIIRHPERAHIFPCLPLVTRSDDMSSISQSIPIGEEYGTRTRNSNSRLEGIETSSVVGGVGKIWGAIARKIGGDIRRRDRPLVGGIYSPRRRYRASIVIPSCDWPILIKGERTPLYHYLFLFFPPKASTNG